MGEIRLFFIGYGLKFRRHRILLVAAHYILLLFVGYLDQLVGTAGYAGESGLFDAFL